MLSLLRLLPVADAGPDDTEGVPGGDQVIRARPPHEWRNVPVDGQRLRELRAQRGLSQQRLADKTDLGITTIRRLECQQHPWCKAWTIDLIAAALDTSVLSLTRADQSETSGGIRRRKPDSNVLAIDAAKSRLRGHVS